MKLTLTILPAGNSSAHDPKRAAYGLKIYEAKGSTERWLCENWTGLGGDAAIADARLSTMPGNILAAAKRARLLASALTRCDVAVKPVVYRVIEACKTAELNVLRQTEEARHLRALVDIARQAEDGEALAEAEGRLAEAEGRLADARLSLKLAIEQAAIAEWRRHQPEPETQTQTK